MQYAAEEVAYVRINTGGKGGNNKGIRDPFVSDRLTTNRPNDIEQVNLVAIVIFFLVLDYYYHVNATAIYFLTWSDTRDLSSR